MNDKNMEMFFGDDAEVVITLTDEDGKDMDAQIMAAFEIEELGTEYLMAIVMSEDGEGEANGEIHALRYQEDKFGNPEVLPIEDEEEMEIVYQAMQRLMENGEFEDILITSGDEEEDSDDHFLDDIGDIFPGVSIDK